MRLTDTVIEDWQDIFEIFDEDNTNKIDASEILKCMQVFKMNTDQPSVDALMKSIDYNEDGVVDFDEFTVLMVKTMVSQDKTEEELVQVFKRFDKDGDGLVGADDLLAMFLELGYVDFDMDAAQEMIRLFDKNEDDYLEFMEFAELLMYNTEDEVIYGLIGAK